MTDLEITKLCSEAMGLLVKYDVFQVDGKTFQSLVCVPDGRRRMTDSNPLGIPVSDETLSYCPLENDAQAMALVKKFSINITRVPTGAGELNNEGNAEEWIIDAWDTPRIGWQEARNLDLNRAICECVAKLQSARASHQ